MIVRVSYTPRPFLIVGIRGEEICNLELDHAENEHEISILRYSIYDPDHSEREIDLPPGEYSSPILVSEITEDDLEDLIHAWGSPTGGDDYQDYYKNYKIEKDEDYMHEFHYTDPIKSLRSILEKERLYYKNPFGLHEPDENIIVWIEGMDHDFSDVQPNPKFKRWKEAQPRVFSDFAIVPLKY